MLVWLGIFQCFDKTKISGKIKMFQTKSCSIPQLCRFAGGGHRASTPRCAFLFFLPRETTGHQVLCVGSITKLIRISLSAKEIPDSARRFLPSHVVNSLTLESRKDLQNLFVKLNFDVLFTQIQTPDEKRDDFVFALLIFTLCEMFLPQKHKRVCLNNTLLL